MQSEYEAAGISFSLFIDQERSEYVTEQLRNFNKAHWETLPTSPDTPPIAAPLEMYAVDTSGTVIGGLIGRTHSIRGWFEVSAIWVKEDERGRGIGRQLMALSEYEAIRRGCRYARLATSDYQAPGFYPKLGYTLYGALENCPPGVTCFYYRKDLTARDSEASSS